MNDAQIALTADLILERFWYFKVEEVKGVLRRAMASARVFDRLDGNLILGWLGEYDARRDEVIEQINVAEKQMHDSPLLNPNWDSNPPPDAISFSEYAESIRKRAAQGDESAIEMAESLAHFELIPEHNSQKQSKADFRRWYLFNYLPNKTNKK